MAYNSTSWTTSGTASTVDTAGVIQYKNFGTHDLSITAGVHNPMIATTLVNGLNATSWAEDTSMFGNGTDPATSLDVSSDGTSYFLVSCLWPLHDSIELSEIKILTSCDQSSGTDTINYHLMKYDIDNVGDLSNGVVLADGTVESNSTTIKSISLTINTSNVTVSSSVDNVLILLVENVDSTSDVTANATIKYKNI